MMWLWSVALREADEQWSVSRGFALFLFLAPALAFVTAAIVRQLDRARWQWYWVEGGPVEWLQVCLLAAAAVLSLLAASRLLPRRVDLGLLYLAVAAGLIFVTGEEIAWGQTVFNYETPARLAQSNYKGEMSLHNVSSLISAFDIGKLLAGIYGTFAALGAIWLRARRNVSVPKVLIPPMFLASSFFFVFAARLLRHTVFRESAPVGYGEFEELCLYFAIAAFTWLVWRDARIGQRDPAATLPADPVT